jgi:tetratricopeptide (TPR) repeat protein
MGKKNKVVKAVPLVKSEIKSSGYFSGRTVYLYFSFFILLIYGSSVNHEFTLDDDVFYLKHGSVQKGFDGIAEAFSLGSMNKFDGTTGTQPYRPVALLYFIFQKVFFDNSPYAAHAFNILLYILVSIVLFRILRRLWPEWNPLIPFMTCIIFISHPVHSEVVSSVKSADELLAALFGLLAWYHFIPRFREVELTVSNFLSGSIFFMLALLSKESAIAWLLIIPLAGVMLYDVGFSKAVRQFLFLIIPVVLFFLMRYNAIGTDPPSNGEPLLNNVLYGAKDLAQLTATKAEILYHYIRLLILPWPLSWDYSFNQIPVVDWTDIRALAGLVIYATLGLLAILRFRKDALLSFCVLFFFFSMSPTNNLFIYNGATVGERFLFVPSIALCIMLVLLSGRLFRVGMNDFSIQGNKMPLTALLFIIIPFSAMSYIRSGEWKNNLTLFEKGVEKCPNSSRTHYSLASEYMKLAQSPENATEREEYFRKAVQHFDLSLRIYPDNMQAHYNSGICYSLIGDTPKAVFYYKEAIRSNPRYVQPINNLGVLYQAMRNVDSALKYYKMAYQISPGASVARKNLGDIYFLMGQLSSSRGQQDSAISFYRISLGFNTGNVFLLNNIASVFSSRANYDSAMYYLERGYALESGSLMIIENIAAVSFLRKDYARAIEFGKKGLALNPRSRKSAGVLMDAYNAMGNRAEAMRYGVLYQSMR